MRLHLLRDDRPDGSCQGELVRDIVEDIAVHGLARAIFVEPECDRMSDSVVARPRFVKVKKLGKHRRACEAVTRRGDDDDCLPERA